MKIGIDLDGVVFDSEAAFRTYEEIFALEELEGSPIIDREEPKFQARYNWTKEQEQGFIDQYFSIISKEESSLMPGFKAVYKRLKALGVEFVVITARGMFLPEMKEDSIHIFEQNGIVFDQAYWMVEDKLEICQKENVDLMIDDDWKIIQRLADNNIHTLYFRDTNLRKIEGNPNVREVNNWGDIYRAVKEKMLEMREE